MYYPAAVDKNTKFARDVATTPIPIRHNTTTATRSESSFFACTRSNNCCVVPLYLYKTHAYIHVGTRGVYGKVRAMRAHTVRITVGDRRDRCRRLPTHRKRLTRRYIIFLWSQDVYNIHIHTHIYNNKYIYKRYLHITVVYYTSCVLHSI